MDLSGGKMTVDHIIPISKGGKRKCPSNLIPSCAPCNEAKGCMTLAEYREINDGNAFYGEKVGWSL